MTGYTKFRSLLMKKGVTAADVSRATGITQSTFTMWKQGKSCPKVDKLIRISEYFGCPLETLL